MDMTSRELINQLAGEVRLADDYRDAASKVVSHLGTESVRALRRQYFPNWYEGIIPSGDPDLRSYVFLTASDGAEKEVFLALAPDNYRCEIVLPENRASTIGG
jgi:hypothetical protein